MLANGITLGYSKSIPATTYTTLELLKTVPDFGVEPEMVENTTINAKNLQYDKGVGDPGDMEFTLKYDENKASSEIRAVFELCDAEEKVAWKITYPDGTAFQWEGIPSYRIVGGSLNDPLELALTISVGSDFERKDPAGA